MSYSGIIIKRSEGLYAIAYNDQPLRANGRIILHMVDNDFKPIKNDQGNPRVWILSEMEYYREMQGATIIGYVD